ncbi:N-acetylneuraminate 9-O-acetyltransferase [Desmophyllum pertusum]|uniref:N-acetylneuraminate 9-O-acetyltransferase n=1 Tax=Desmophyllum pertusum TaxID=174260 RepID=A0A9X0D9I8_9CNID|nr:N-acetylneuraminate 9-O-acetyltransferase [Desmophyllum pertusum]
MAVGSELTGATLHLSDVEQNPKEMIERKKDAPKQLPVTSRIEICCKTVAFLIVLCLICVHLARVNREGSSTCPGMFRSGRWRESFWQPHGCMMHSYISSEIRTCLQNHPVAFIGDSRTRGLYYELVETVSLNAVEDEGKAHNDLSYVDKLSNTSVSFYWQPEVNLSMKSLYDDWTKNPQKSPHLIITGSGTWTIKNQGLDAVMNYGYNLTKVKGSMETLVAKKKNESQALPKKSSLFPPSPVIVWIQQEPVVESKLHEARKMITNEKVDLFNSIAEEMFLKDNSSVTVMWTSFNAAKKRPETSTDGLHYGEPITTLELDLIFNYYCNQYLQVSDATCCVPAPRLTHLQRNTFAVFITCIVLFLIMFVCQHLWPAEPKGSHGAEPTTPGGHPSSSLRWVYSDRMYPVMKSLFKMGLIMFYFYLCDRTNLFYKEQKEYSNLVFVLVLIVFLALGAWTWAPTQQTVVLNRDQTNEWKGWMQLFILLYHYIGASKVLPIYVFIRLLVASYIFLSGYGHFSFFWNKGDFGLYRFCQVMTRMNILVAVLCLIMGRPYQFYYFVPLVSFWFVVIYAVLAVWPRVTAALVKENHKHYVVILVKFFFFFGVISTIWSSPLLCQWIFSQWAIKELFIDENDSVREWWFRSWLDRYIALFGMVVAFAYCTAKYLKMFDDNNKRTLFSRPVGVACVIFAVVAIVSYAIQAFTCSSKLSCNETHSAVSFIPIIAFVLLRNVPGPLRAKFSRFYAWVGTISLELFIAQYHIWLAHDTKGVLVLIPDQPLLNVILTTFVFVCVSHEIQKVSGVLANALITKDMKTMIRRVLFFIFMLIIIWWHKTRHDPKPILT